MNGSPTGGSASPDSFSFLMPVLYLSTEKISINNIPTAVMYTYVLYISIYSTIPSTLFLIKKC